MIGVACAAAVAAAAMAGCSTARQGSSIAATAAYIAQPTGKTTVGYLDIRNNGAADRLISVSTSVGGTVEFRGTLHDGKAEAVAIAVGIDPTLEAPEHAGAALGRNARAVIHHFDHRMGIAPLDG